MGRIGNQTLHEPAYVPTTRVNGVRRIVVGDEIHLIYYADVPTITDGVPVVEHHVVARVVWLADAWATQMQHIRAEGVAVLSGANYQ